jgi:hypothetical protein
VAAHDVTGRHLLDEANLAHEGRSIGSALFGVETHERTAGFDDDASLTNDLLEPSVKQCSYYQELALTHNALAACGPASSRCSWYASLPATASMS